MPGLVPGIELYLAGKTMAWIVAKGSPDRAPFISKL
jgi:hypothetical protein